ncbi:maternal effect embryo arrest protein [Trifolium repens]|nr:maternal effect embryo arrest protein [Trifolium repens]
MFLPPFASTTAISPSMSDISRRKLTTTSIHIMALDGIVNVNSLFTLALFLGITSTNTDSTLVGDNPTCVAGSSVAESLISYHVYSFSSFLFSSLIALAIKNVINISKGGVDGAATNYLVQGYFSDFAVEVNTVALRLGTLVSAFGSVFGCGFLVMALVDLVQIKLGTLACGSHYTLAAITPLLILVPAALLIYVILVLYAFTR